MMTLDGGEYSISPTAAMTAECLSSSGSSSLRLNPLLMIKNKKDSKNQRRFSDEQIRSLENMFASESKLEPRKKLQLARELGLQPRQVAIWFQNKRARWKSKQLERDYSILRANYNTLASQFENLKKEKQALIIQLQKLNDLMHKSTEENPCCSQAAEKSIENQLDDHLGNKFNTEFATKLQQQQQGSMLERPEHRIGIGVLSDDDSSSIKAENFGLDEEPDLLNIMEPADSSLTSPENWGSLDSDGNQWWDFWS